LVRDRIDEQSSQIEAEFGESGELVVDLSDVDRIDSAGVALLTRTARRLEAQGRQLRLENPSAEVANTLRLFPALGGPPAPRALPGPLEALGDRAHVAGSAAVRFLSMSADLAWFTVGGLFRPRTLRRTEIVDQMATIGSRALGVVGLIGLLLGATLALQSAAQLRRFGANIYVVDLSVISITREIGPLITAIIVTGRSGSAICAEIATMVVTEEVDALRTMGINPIRFLVVPKLIAMTITQPLLTMFANAFGVIGTFLVALVALDVAPVPFVIRLEQALLLKDVLTGLVKSIVFAHLIVAIAALIGFETRGGPDAVGRSTTMSVVFGIVAVIAADAVASFVFYF
jgi:phospholipid/cholesterol/gamma-HCH transport system permease protein